METKRFQRHKEDFTCEQCGASVTGNGYTNHCPRCLWSKHVDNSPGDRANGCKGLMRPTGIVVKADQRWVQHRCQYCGEERRVKILPEDSLEAQLQVMQGR